MSDNEHVRVFISQVMGGRTEDEIMKERERLSNAAEALIGKRITVADTFIHSAKEKHPLILLGEAIKQMADADYAVFGPGTKNARGCRVEYGCAKAYGVKIIEIHMSA